MRLEVDLTVRVLVTGHRGYIGAVLTPMFLAAGHEVTGLDSDLFRACTFGDPAALAEVPSLTLDLRDVREADLRGFDAVVHLAALSNDPLGDLDPVLTYAINHAASIRLATLAKAAGVPRFVFSSSCSNYGAAGERPARRVGGPAARDSIRRVEGPGRARPHGAWPTTTFSPTSLRNATAYGVSPRLRFDIVLNNLVAWAFTTGRVLIKSDGSPWRPIVHIEDIARAFLAVLDAPREAVHGEAFNVGSTTENYQIRDIADVVARVVPSCRIEYAPGASPDTRNYRVRCDKIAERLGFATTWTAEAGARELLDAYRAVGLTLDQFEGPRYQRIAHVRSLLADGTLDADLRFSEPAASRPA